MSGWAEDLPETGLGETEALELIGGLIDARSVRLGDPTAFAHMDPPPPAIAAEIVGRNAAVNQNLLHPDLSPFAGEAEAVVIRWVGRAFGMAAGHMCGGSTIANLTGLWAAREAGARRVVASVDAHISVPKCAAILGMPYEAVPVDRAGRIGAVGDLSDAAYVPTAGTTGRGVIDPLERRGALWLHIDAAWAGPLRLTRFGGRLDGIEAADSIAISAHKWFFQPKDSALILFKDASAQEAISFGGGYLTTPNVGVQGSRSAAATALLATLTAWGRAGLEARLSACLATADDFAARLAADPRFVLKQWPETAVVNWRLAEGDTRAALAQLKPVASQTVISGEIWGRNVAANPSVDVDAVWARMLSAL